jgi:anti-sigma B factor antagonist
MMLPTEDIRLDVRREGATTVTRLVGEDFSVNLCEAAVEQLSLLVHEGKVEDLVLDFAGVRSVDSTGLGKLIGLHKKVQRAGGRLILINVFPRVYEAFESTRLTRLLDVRMPGADEPPAGAGR